MRRGLCNERGCLAGKSERGDSDLLFLIRCLDADVGGVKADGGNLLHSSSLRV